MTTHFETNGAARRKFLKSAAVAGLATALGPSWLAMAATPKPQRVLVLGGTGFIGPHIVRAALAAGHEVSIFNRGKTNPDLFPGVENLVGDRDGDLESLKGKSWDVVIDNSGYVPRHVRDSVQLLKNAADHYLFTSTAGIYQAVVDGSWPEGEVTEDAPAAALPEPGSEEVGKYYGQLKALCEAEVREAFPGRCTITRPGLIVGPGDTTDRYTYYPARMDRGGEMLAFGSPEDPVQYIDARDLAAFSLHCCEQRTSGTFHLVGPDAVMTMGEMLNGIRQGIGADVQFTWVDAAFLAEMGVEEGSVMPWISPIGQLSGIARLSNDRAFAAGLTFRPVPETARDTLTWWKEQPEDYRQAMSGGLRGGSLPQGPASLEQQMAREAEILAAWKAR